MMHDVPDNPPISGWAIVSVAVGLMTLLAILVPDLIWLGLLGMAGGWLALRQIHRYELAGRSIARTGIGVSLLCLVGIPTAHWLGHRYEALPGYRRLDFQTSRTWQEWQDNGPWADQLGQRVCLKGYLSPNPNGFRARYPLLFSPDRGESSFGTDYSSQTYIAVELKDNQWRKEAVAISGTLSLLPPDDTDKKPLPRYALTQATLRPVWTMQRP